jgi:hypothetical protein
MSLDYTETGPSCLPNFTGGRETSRTLAAAKRKGPAQTLPGTPSASEIESDDDRDSQIRIDAEVAAAWRDRARRRPRKERRQELKNKYLLARVKALEEQLAAFFKADFCEHI